MTHQISFREYFKSAGHNKQETMMSTLLISEEDNFSRCVFVLRTIHISYGIGLTWTMDIHNPKIKTFLYTISIATLFKYV